jgi:hypothetical protein
MQEKHFDSRAHNRENITHKIERRCICRSNLDFLTKQNRSKQTKQWLKNGALKNQTTRWIEIRTSGCATGHSPLAYLLSLRPTSTCAQLHDTFIAREAEAGGSKLGRSARTCSPPHAIVVVVAAVRVEGSCGPRGEGRGL